MEESGRTLLFQFPIEKIFTQEQYTTLIDNFRNVDLDKISYEITVYIDGVLDRKKIIKKVEEEIDKNIENELEELYKTSNKKDIANVIKELNSKKILLLEHEKEKLEKMTHLVITKEYEVDKNKSNIENIIKSYHNVYEECIKPILISQ